MNNFVFKYILIYDLLNILRFYLKYFIKENKNKIKCQK